MTTVINTHDTGAETSKAPEGHDQEMQDKVDSKNQEIAELEQADKPEKILGKFETVDDLTAAYQELERKLSTGKTDEATDSGEATSETEDETTETDDTDTSTEDEVVEKAGLDMETLRKTYEETGALTDEDYEALAKVNIDKDTVDEYIKGQEAQATLLRMEVFKTVGGEDNFNNMVEWAAANYSEDEIRAFNRATDSGDLDAIKDATQVLAMKYTKANGSDPSLVNGDPASTSVDVFESTAQLTKAMGDPRYETDPAYRKAVAEKLARSSIM